MAGRSVSVRDNMGVVSRSIVVTLQVDTVHKGMRRRCQDICHNLKVVSHVLMASAVLVFIGGTVSLGTLTVILDTLCMGDVEGQLEAARGKDLQTVTLIGFQRVL